MSSTEIASSNNFIRHIIVSDLNNNKNHGELKTRFPPEPNGYLHIGHAKSICLNFGLANEFSGQCNLRFDDTNPEKEGVEYELAIKEDVAWLGFEWSNLHYASNYYLELYNAAIQLISTGHAYVDSLSADEIREYRGNLTEPGKESPDRNRGIDENLDLFKRMRAGEFSDGDYILRAKIDMASGNINLRDPALYRIKRHTHYRTGDQWCIYPMYDFAHCVSDALEGITHSICTLEFEDHRPLYDWILDKLDSTCHPQQIEFAPLNLEHTILSKRKLIHLVNENIVNGWDDPRMPTISGLRRRGFTAASIRKFCDLIGVTKNDATIKMSVLENVIREDLNASTPRKMAVLNPLKLIITNYPEEKTELLTIDNHPQRSEMGSRTVPFTKEIYIEENDFSLVPPPKFRRLIEGGEVRLRGAYVIRCNQIIKANSGKVLELHCTYDKDTLGKKPDGRKVKGVIHWVSQPHSLNAEVRIYEPLFASANPSTNSNYIENIASNSITILTQCKVESSLGAAKPEERFQFERQGYFVADRHNFSKDKLVFNRTITLRDNWS